MSGTQLSFSCRTQIEKDLTEERRAYFEFYLSRRPALKAVFFFGEKLPPTLKGLACLLFSSLVPAGRPGYSAGRPVAVEKLVNERRQISLLEGVLAQFGCVRWRIGGAGRFLFSAAYFWPRALLYPRATLGLMRLFRNICRRYPLYVSVRAAEAVFHYLYFRDAFRRRRPSFVVSSSDGNPHGRGLMGAAWAEEIPLVFASHGAVASNPVRVKAALAILFGKKSERELIEKGSLIGEILFYGFKQEKREILSFQRIRAVLICLAHAPDLTAIANLCAVMKAAEPNLRLRLRPHPNSLASAEELKEAAGEGIEFSRGGALAEDLEEVNVVIAGSSTVHLECLLGGRPTVYLADLDSGNTPPLAFLREDLIFRWSDREKLPVWEEVTEFYARPDFAQKLGAFLNLDSTNEEFLSKLEASLGRFRL